MKYRLIVTPEVVNAGNLIYPETYSLRVRNTTGIVAELRYDGLVTTGGISHVPPPLPLDLATGLTQGFTVGVTTEGPLRIDGTLQQDWHFDVQAQVNARNGYGPMIYNGLIVNAYHPEVGRGGYFHTNSGTSEGQGVMILACFRAYEVLRNSPATLAVGEYYRDLAVTMLNAMGEFDNNGPMLRQAIPDNPDTITLLHWLFAAKGPVNLQTVVLDYAVTVAGGQVVVPASALGEGISTVFKLYPANKELLYSSPYSPVIGGGEVIPTGQTQNPDGSLTLTTSAAAGAYKLVYSYFSTQSLPLGSAYEAYPVWTAIPEGYAACAPDTFRWFDMALNKAIELGLPRDAGKWLKLRDALRRTVVKGQNLSDLREVIRPMPKVGVFATDGMFCYSGNPYAKAPPVGSGLDPSWVGYNFFSRNSITGNIQGEVPLASTNPADGAMSTTQIGRGFEDSWRIATPYQEADQFLLVEMGIAQNQNITTLYLNNKPNFRPFISTTREYNPATRYLADPNTAAAGGQWDWTDVGTMRTLLFPRTAFKNAAGQVFPAGGQILNFGVDLTAPATIGYTINLRDLRLVSGPSPEWVINNLTEVRKGSQLPYFPGAIPFATNADLIGQEFVGYNGNPFHGYQLPDLWLDLAAEAEIVHPVLTSASLPTANPNTQEIRYEINLQNANGSAKPKHLALMEQQLIFLRDAADVFFRDHGIRGPFAHTFVLNTPARFNIGGPAPHTWVYTNDDPNTRWAGYQVRVIESLAVIVDRTSGDDSAGDSHALAKLLCINWLTWLNGVWPNLNGSPYRGMPTDFPQTGAPQTNYEEVHSTAIILRACLHLKRGTSDADALCNAIMQRCWDYMESFWNTTGEMKYTWSTRPADRWWYGFWHAEIIWTLTTLLNEGAAFASPGIPLATARERLLLTSQWLDTTGVLDARHRVEIPITGIRGEMVGANPTWDLSYQVSRTYKTDIFVSTSGEEQRRAIRQTPRKTLDFNVIMTQDELRDFQTTMSIWQNRSFTVPELTRFIRLSEDVAAGSSFLPVDEVPDWLAPGGLIVVTDRGMHEIQVVNSILNGRLYLTAVVQRAWPAGTKVAHCLAGHLEASFDLSRDTNRVARGALTLSVDPGSETYPTPFEVPSDDIYPGLTTYPDMSPMLSVPSNSEDLYFYDGDEIFLLRNNWGQGVTEGREWPVAPVDYGFGVVEWDWDIEFSTRTLSATITVHTVARQRYLEKFFDRMRGAQGNFWMPTWENDLPISSDIVAETQSITVTASRAARLLLSSPIYRDIAVVTNTMDVYANSILAVDIVDGKAVLSLRDPWPVDLSADDILMVSWLLAWRMSADEQIFSWITDGVAQVVFECRTDKAERYDPEDVANLRRAIVYTSKPYPMLAEDELNAQHSSQGAFYQWTPSDSLDTAASFSQVTLTSPVKFYTTPDHDNLDVTSAILSGELRGVVQYLQPFNDDLDVASSVVDGSLTVKIKTTQPFVDLIDATAQITYGALNATGQ
ncbi:hypothetical protein GOD54_23665 [Sinorhizobium medicae]|nr:hypothetical protein [Sinorhizobium medicae]